MASVSSPTHAGGRMNLVASGWALSAALVVLFLLCLLVALLWPTPAFSHAWIQLFTAAPIGSLANVAEGVGASIVAAWIVALVFVPVYNWLVGRN